MRLFGYSASKKGKNEPDENCDNEGFIEHDTLIILKVARGKHKSTQSYQVLSIFSKHNNKYFFRLEDKRLLLLRTLKESTKSLCE